MTTRLRLTAGAAALSAGLWFLSAAPAADISADTYKKGVEAEIAQLKKHLEHIAANPGDAKRFAPTAKSSAMILAAYGEATGDDALMKGALKVAEALASKPADFKAAAEAAGKLAPKPGAKPLAPAGLHKLHKFDVSEVMCPFKPGKTGGFNMEKDIKDMVKKKDPAPVDPAAVEVLAARTAIIGKFTLEMPFDTADKSKATRAKWDGLTKDMIDVSQKLAAESAKGKKADEKEVVKMLTKLDNTCYSCHQEFRDN